ncbi:MAG: transcription antitermination factor NusB [Armatimonadota bacterium]|nr:transcription antitermination factor NusB [bacterium]MCS7309561.1 transcription antitermination factor NusB [Armatimonadota bacterium]MDW8104742.1 transcription antitermination factor NusB [Armatimonadota bacterium]MDW8291060.1 transcription antitermination factor NusB [Armatimonadota bacterium]
MSSSTLRHKQSANARRLARELALRLLYQVDIGQIPLEECFEFAVEHMPLDEAGQRFARELASGTLQHQQKIDSIIARFAIGWPPERQPAPDRNVLRLAIYELLHHPETPQSVVISEAVELAKKYNSDESGKFVNGVLASVLKHLEEYR